MRTFVEDASNAAIRLLASGVPYLQLNYVLIVDSHYIVAKLYSDCHIVIFIEHIVSNSHQN